MGTIVSLSCDAAAEPDLVVSRVRDTFAHFDDVFSLYKPESELSRIGSNRMSLVDASDEVRDVYSEAIEWRAATNGEFSPHRPDGVIDLSGIVKALAMNRAGEQLNFAGAKDWCLNVGGDVLVSGLEGSSEPWNIGITDPLDRGTLITSARLAAPRTACATSGSSERGDHIWTAGATPTQFIQATVIANDIITADVLATAIIAGGAAALDRICGTWDVDAMTTDLDGNFRMTPGFAKIPAAV
ncbi:MAG TPA: FAD:protein FMN transferase [Galbitalea sp.]